MRTILVKCAIQCQLQGQKDVHLLQLWSLSEKRLEDDEKEIGFDGTFMDLINNDMLYMHV